MRSDNVVMQQRDYSCGAASLATLIRYHWGDNVTETGLLLLTLKILTNEEMQDRIRNGFSLTDLRRLAVKLGYQASIGKLVIGPLAQEVASFGIELQSMAGGDCDPTFGWQDTYLSSPAMRIAGGTDEIMRNILAERVLRLPPEPRMDKDVPFREIPTGRPS